MMKRLLFVILLLLSNTSYAECLLCGLRDTFKDAFDKQGLIILAVGAGATTIAFSQDQAMHDTWVNHQRMSSDVSQVGNFWGMGIAEAGIALGQIILDKENGIADAEGLIASTIVTFELKYSTQRARPDSDTRTSFPSGHTQVSFASATNLFISYGWKVGIPAYSMAVFTGISRLADDAHWLSDIVAGAAIGSLFGRAAFKHHIIITPVTYGPQDRGYGIDLSYNF